MPTEPAFRALSWWIEAGLARLAIAALRALPERVALATGAFGGRAALHLSPRYRERAGGYTRVIRAGVRRGDDTKMAILELVE